jgi:hypothetical protein
LFGVNTIAAKKTESGFKIISFATQDVELRFQPPMKRCVSSTLWSFYVLDRGRRWIIAQMDYNKVLVVF